MNKKQIFIGLGLLAVVVGVFIYKKKKEEKSGADGDGDFKAGNYEKAWSADGDQDWSNASNCKPTEIECTKGGVAGQCCTRPKPAPSLRTQKIR